MKLLYGRRILLVSLFLIFQNCGLKAELAKFRITKSLASESKPDISGNTVVWQDSRYSTPGGPGGYYRTSSIFGADITDPNNPTEFLISNKGIAEEYPQVSGQYVVTNITRYNCKVGYDHWDKYDVHVYELNGLSKQVTSALCSPPNYSNRCNTDGKYVVWQTGGIKGYDIETDSLFNMPISIAHSTFALFAIPDVSEGNVVWSDWDSDNSTCTIHVFNIAEWQDYIVSVSAVWITSPKIDGNIIVFSKDSDIYAIDISDLNSPREFPICTEESIQSDPAISGNVIVWVDYRNGNSDIYGYNLLTQEEFCVISDSDGKTSPAIDDQTVVWTNNKNGQIDIYGTILDGSIVPYCTAPIPGDLNNDCKVDLADLTILVSHWLKCNIEPQAACWE